MNHRQKVTINGKEKWVTHHGTQDLVNFVIDTMNERNQPNDIEFRQYAEEWYKTFKEPQITCQTADGFRSKLERHIYPFVGHMMINSIRVADVQRILNSCTSASSAKWTKSIVNQIINAAIADELYTRPNPTIDPRIVMPTERKKRLPVAKQDISLMIDCLPNLSADVAPLCTILLMTGCRRQEALGARWEDINWENMTIHLQRVIRFVRSQPVVSEKMKTPAANRTVSIWENMIQYLGTPKKEGFIIHCDGKPLTERMYYTRWKRLSSQLIAAGVSETFTAHQLRHSYATIAANSGNVPPKVLQGMLGHANFQTTMNIYADLDTDRMRESSMQLGDEYAKIAANSCRKDAGSK